MAEENSKSGLGRVIIFLVVLGLVFVAVKIVIGWVLTLLKWALIAAVALFVTWLIFRKSDSGSS